MAKRKRLEPARLADAIAAPETKTALPRAPLSGRPPIADVAHDAATSAALGEVAAELTAARQQERLIQTLPVTAIVTDYLVRDRAVIDPEELQALVDSLRTRGQQTAIEVADLGDGRFGLISGYRRVLALSRIAQTSGTPGKVLAIVRRDRAAAEAYQSMVEENELRANLTFYERGRIVARAVDAGVYRADRLALAALFASVPRARRSKIGAFVTIVRHLDDVLRFPTALSEKQGLFLAKRLSEEPDLAVALRRALTETPPEDAEAEAAILAGGAPLPPPATAEPAPAELAPPAARPRAAPEDLDPGLQIVRHADGGISLRGDRMRDPDFVAQVMAAVKALL